MDLGSESEARGTSTSAKNLLQKINAIPRKYNVKPSSNSQSDNAQRPISSVSDSDKRKVYTVSIFGMLCHSSELT